MLDKHEISSKSTRGKKLIIEARKRSFPVVQQRMHDFPDKEPSGDITMTIFITNDSLKVSS